jgi:hypothetical protein
MTLPEDIYRARLIPLDRLGSLDDQSERRRFFDGMYSRPDLAKQMGTNSRPELEELMTLLKAQRSLYRNRTREAASTDRGSETFPPI